MGSTLRRQVSLARERAVEIAFFWKEDCEFGTNLVRADPSRLAIYRRCQYGRMAAIIQ
jgi:hypothetical protein